MVTIDLSKTVLQTKSFREVQYSVKLTEVILAGVVSSAPLVSEVGAIPGVKFTGDLSSFITTNIYSDYYTLFLILDTSSGKARIVTYAVDIDEDVVGNLKTRIYNFCLKHNTGKANLLDNYIRASKRVAINVPEDIAIEDPKPVKKSVSDADFFTSLFRRSRPCVDF